MHIGKAASGQGQALGFIPVKQSGIDTGVLVERQRALGTIGRQNQAQLAAFFLCREMLLLVARRHALAIGHDPNLQKMHLGSARGVVFAVAHPGASAHELHIAGLNHRTCAQGVFVLQGAFQHIRKNLHVPVAMGVKASRGAHAVFVDHQQVGKPHVLGVVVAAERKAVLRMQPAEVGEAACCSGAKLCHVHILVGATARRPRDRAHAPSHALGSGG